jgi:hypothetical protein
MEGSVQLVMPGILYNPEQRSAVKIPAWLKEQQREGVRGRAG